MTLALLILFVASIWAGAQNALAGGGSFITLQSLMLTGMDPRAANITSCVALFPAQIVMGVTGRADARNPPGTSLTTLVLISLVGGALGAGAGAAADDGATRGLASAGGSVAVGLALASVAGEGAGLGLARCSFGFGFAFSGVTSGADGKSNRGCDRPAA